MKFKKEGRKMKLIDLLNIWVNNKDKLPKKIKIKNRIFEYHEFGNLYLTSDESCFLITDYLDCVEKLSREVEVIEENKEIGEFKTEYTMRNMDIQFQDKINELVRAVNKLNKEREEK